MSSYSINVDKPDSCLNCKLRGCLHTADGSYQVCALQVPHYGFKSEPFFKSEDLVEGWISPKCPLEEREDISFVGVNLKTAVDQISNDPHDNFNLSAMSDEARSGFNYGLSLIKTLVEVIYDTADNRGEFIVLTDDSDCIRYSTYDLKNKVKGEQT